MPHEILIHGRRLDPREAAALLLPFDTLLVCPNCEGLAVQACEPKLTARLDRTEPDGFIPRKQDRWCLACGHRWTTVLPPVYHATPGLLMERR